MVHTPINQVLGPGAAGRRWGCGSIHSGPVTCIEEASTEDRWLGVGASANGVVRKIQDRGGYEE